MYRNYQIIYLSTQFTKKIHFWAMEKFMKFKNIFYKKKVVITGHTGFKGSWLTLWLNLLGAKVYGISNRVLTKPSLYEVINLKKDIKQKFFDLKDIQKTKEYLKKIKPDFVFHLAAQAIVKKSYSDPYKTWQSNLNGTLSILESLKVLNKKKCIAIIITSDKVYKNIETEKGYKENDILGGIDPYSASKGATEFLINSYIQSIYPKKGKLRLSIARAGNVIGGGDSSEGRLVPDCIRAWSKRKKVKIRNANSTRPWQHVLEVIWGYICLAVKLQDSYKYHGEAYNFGPKAHSKQTVLQLLNTIKKGLVNFSWSQKRNKFLKESKLLKLNSRKAKKDLKWECKLNFKDTVGLMLEWYKNFYRGNKNMKKFSLNQIKYYSNILKINYK